MAQEIDGDGHRRLSDQKNVNNTGKTTNDHIQTRETVEIEAMELEAMEMEAMGRKTRGTGTIKTAIREEMRILRIK